MKYNKVRLLVYAPNLPFLWKISLYLYQKTRSKLLLFLIDRLLASQQYTFVIQINGYLGSCNVKQRKTYFKIFCKSSLCLWGLCVNLWNIAKNKMENDKYITGKEKPGIAKNILNRVFIHKYENIDTQLYTSGFAYQNYSICLQINCFLCMKIWLNLLQIFVVRYCVNFLYFRYIFCVHFTASNTNLFLQVIIVRYKAIY